MSQRPALSASDELHRRALVIDSLAGGPGVYSRAMLEELETLTTLSSTPELFREIERLQTAALRAGGFGEYWTAIDLAGADVLSVSVGAWGDTAFSFRGAVHDLGEWHRRVAREPRFRLVREPGDLLGAKQRAQVGVLLGFQNCTQLEGDLRNVEVFQGLGIRMIQLTYNGRNEAGWGCTAGRDEGLTSFGRSLIQALNTLGIIVDVSHCGPDTTIDAIRHSSAPVAVSHGACQALHPHPRNKNDEVLRALADTGGYFGVCAVPAFLAPRSHEPSLDDMGRHISHVLQVCGVHGVGIGTDWGVAQSPPTVTRRLQAEATRRGFTTGHEFDFTARTKGFENWSSGLPAITGHLADLGLPSETIEGVLGTNFLRYYQAVQAHAHDA